MFDIKKSLFSLALATSLLPVCAQQVSFKASIDSAGLLIGQQSRMHLEVSGPASLKYTFPAFPGDSLVKGIEIYQAGPLDTLDIGNNLITLRKDYLITSFDSGLYYIPPVKLLAGLDTIASNELALKIMTYEVDTTKKQIYDIKGVQAPPFVLGDYATFLLIVFALWALALLIIWYVLKKKYGVDKPELAPELLLPPHVVAIMELDRLKAEKVWKLGKNKQYYTELSAIIRKYIQRRFQINAPEMTTDEILALFKRDKNTQSVYQNLRQILQLADLVKFAKIEPQENDNELSIMNSYLFVNQTRIEEVKTTGETDDTLQTDDLKVESEPVVSIKDDEMKKYQPK